MACPNVKPVAAAVVFWAVVNVDPRFKAEDWVEAVKTSREE